ncbi:hypothetical protein CB1_035116001 [Camelus ferus]|nr:hypothetical protein CB1_035116001 [Camelus ferus]
MTAQGSLVANRGRRFKWAIELSGPGGGSRGRSDRGGGQGDSLYPVGYLDKQVPDTSVQETDRILVEKAAYEYLTVDGPYPEYLVAKLLEIGVTLVDIAPEMLT